jgi:PAS domain S-box-containing protein
MTLQFTPVVLLYVLAALISFALAYRAWRMRPARGAELGSLAMVSCGIWATGEAMAITCTDLEVRLAITRFEYLGIIATPVFWNLFAISYSHYERWLNKVTIGLLGVVPAVTYALVLTLDRHPLIYQSVEMVQEGGLWFMEKVYGPAFWAWLGYVYLIVLGGSLLLIQAILRSPFLFRGQAVMLILGALTPVISNLLYVIDRNPMHPFDPSSIAFTISGILVAIALFRYRFLDVVPVAYDLVFKSVKSGVLVLDTQGRIMEMNPTAERILERSQGEVLGRTIEETFPQYRDVWRQFEEVEELKMEVALGDGGAVYELQITPLPSRFGRPAGRILMLHDITDREHLLEEQERFIEELNTYAYTVAHDLKNPLGVVIGYATLLERAGADMSAEQIQEITQLLIQTAFKMESIISALLLLARVRRRQDVEIVSLDMTGVVASALARLSDEIEKAEAEIVVRDNWPLARGYAPWVEEVWVNYVDNAIKYGGKPPTIELGADEPVDGMVRFWVRDNGRGLPEEATERLFREFSRLTEHQEVEGHGLGLAIVRRIVARLGGSVGVESEVGRGSLFYFSLPADG